MREVISSGEGEGHLGWLEPGKTVCLGVGPVTLRYTKEEAEALCATLQGLLAESEGVAHAWTFCGCKPDTNPANPTLKSQFWDGPAWGQGVG